MSQVTARERALMDENETLKERVRQLEELLVFDKGWRPPAEWRLSKSESLIMGLLVSRNLVTRDACMAVIYGADGREPASESILGVWVARIRDKVKPFGVSVKTRWGQGFYLEPSVRAALQVGATAISAKAA